MSGPCQYRTAELARSLSHNVLRSELMWPVVLEAPTPIFDRGAMRLRNLFLLSATFMHFPTAASGQWSMTETVDPISDRRTVAATVAGRGGETRVAALFGAPELRIECSGELATLTFESLGTVFGDRADQFDVTLRIDRGTPLEAKFRTTGEGTGGWIWNVGPSAGTLVDIIDQIAHGARLVLRAWDYRGVPHTYTWVVSGASSAIQELGCL